MKIVDHIADNIAWYVGGLWAVLILGGLVYNFNPLSRRTLNPAGKVMEYTLPNDFHRMINVSSGGSEGDVMVTYETIDGKLFTKEYNRAGLWETDIKWVRPNAETAKQE